MVCFRIILASLTVLSIVHTSHAMEDDQEKPIRVNRIIYTLHARKRMSQPRPSLVTHHAIQAFIKGYLYDDEKFNSYLSMRNISKRQVEDALAHGIHGVEGADCIKHSNDHLTVVTDPTSRVVITAYYHVPRQRNMQIHAGDPLFNGLLHQELINKQETSGMCLSNLQIRETTKSVYRSLGKERDIAIRYARDWKNRRKF